MFTAGLLLVVYALYVLYTVVGTNAPHDAERVEADGTGETANEQTAATWSLRQAVGVLAAAVGGIVIVSEVTRQQRGAGDSSARLAVSSWGSSSFSNTMS